MEIIQSSWNMLQAEAASYHWGVQIWMRVMATSFAIGLVFAPWRSGARWIVAALIVNLIGLISIKAAYPNFSRADIGTFIHLIFWSFAMRMVWKKDARDALKKLPTSAINRIYLIWLIWASAVMTVSLLIDSVVAVQMLF
jgi:hypothetical protein